VPSALQRSGLWAPPTEGDDQADVELTTLHLTAGGRVSEWVNRATTPAPERAESRFPSGDIEQPSACLVGVPGRS